MVLNDEDHPGSGLRDVGRFGGYGLTLGVAIALFAWIGSVLDKRFHTEPLFVLLGTFTGFGAGFYSMYRHLVLDRNDELRSGKERDEGRARDVRRAGYLWVTLALAAGGVIAASAGGHPAVPVAIGAGIAWGVQAGSFWLLASGLERGESIARVWAAGMAARFGVGILVWGLAMLAGAPTRALMIAYGMALVVFLLLEAGWLAVTTANRTVRR